MVLVNIAVDDAVVNRSTTTTVSSVGVVAVMLFRQKIVFLGMHCAALNKGTPKTPDVMMGGERGVSCA